VLAMCADVRLMSGGTIGLTELAVGVPFPVAALEICRDTMGVSAARAALQAKTIDADTALARGWIDAVVPKDEVLTQALAAARELGQYSPAAYAATKKQLHKPVLAAIDAGTTTDENVRASWISEETPRPYQRIPRVAGSRSLRCSRCEPLDRPRRADNQRRDTCAAR